MMAEASDYSRRAMLMKKLADGATGELSRHEMLELLLLYSVEQGDTDEIVAKLIDYFGSVSEVMEADVLELERFHEIKRKSAVLLSMIPQISRKILIERSLGNQVNSMDDIKAFVTDCFTGKTVEHFLLVCLDKNNRVLRYDFVSKGSVSSSNVDLRKMIHLSLMSNARYAVIAHNHPRGIAYPSKEDRKTTRVILNAFKNIDVKLLDHIIVSSGGCYSIAEAPDDISCCLKATD